MTLRSKLVVALSAWGCLMAIGLTAQKGATEAPAGFDTPTLQTQNAGTMSVSNGIAEPPGDTFVRDQEIFERTEVMSTEEQAFFAALQ